MPIQCFSFPIPETRFFQVGQHIYKFKIRPGSKISGKDEMLDSELVSEELENAVRVVLFSLDSLHPFATQHFIIFPYKNRWERVSELRFRKGDRNLFAYPFLITLYVETNIPIPPLIVHATEQIPPGRESALDSPPPTAFFPLSPAKRKRTEQPQEGALSLDDHYDNLNTPHRGASPCLANGAGAVCGREIYPESEESFQSTPGAKNIELDVDQENPDTPVSTDSEKLGVLARLASAVFPFSLLFHRT
ncbi:membrane-anchored junction protein [Trichomycterus rosablanca]|uniref:membrane-anchored junction protein n=1 Tax=Trichomycterus rosablanca TaxID=2290929 RepID=UPI002F350B05